MKVASFPSMNLRFPETIEAWRKRNESNSVWLSIVEGFRPIPAGNCYYGAESSEDNVQAIHVEAFQLHRYPVTNVMYELFDLNHRYFSRVTANRNHSGNDDNCPVVNVTWFDAKCFALWCGSVKRKIDLPTERQWEHACRAGMKFCFSFGDREENLGEHSWYHDNTNDNDIHAKPVGLKKPNGNQLYDMHGNVSEWCDDWSDFYENTKVVRGGCWSHSARGCRASYRDEFEPDVRALDGGFRLACTVAE
jgi:formylglycine-generating enzyme required for sulfatase activity